MEKRFLQLLAIYGVMILLMVMTKQPAAEERKSYTEATFKPAYKL